MYSQGPSAYYGLMSEDRWDRLQCSLKQAGIDCTLYRRNSESSEITITERDLVIVIADTWWSKNIDVWTGWHVLVEDRNGIVRRPPTTRTKTRGEVVAAAQAAVGWIGRQS